MVLSEVLVNLKNKYNKSAQRVQLSAKAFIYTNFGKTRIYFFCIQLSGSITKFNGI